MKNDGKCMVLRNGHCKVMALVGVEQRALTDDPTVPPHEFSVGMRPLGEAADQNLPGLNEATCLDGGIGRHDRLKIC